MGGGGDCPPEYLEGGLGHGVEAVLQLQQQLHDKDMKLTDIRLEALSSAHHLESLRDTMNRMKVGGA